jgi:hypothetical protein
LDELFGRITFFKVNLGILLVLFHGILYFHKRIRAIDFKISGY